MMPEPIEQYFKLQPECGLQQYISTYSYQALGYSQQRYGKVFLGQGEWAKFNLYWNYLQQWRVLDLNLHYLDYIDNQPKIPMLIKINFPCLQKLTLSCNKIESIDALYYLNAPDLSEIDLTDNYITCIKVLIKLFRNTKIAFLRLNLNNIDDISVLTRLDFHADVKQLNLQMSHRKVQVDLRYIFKCNYKKLKCLRTNAELLNSCFFPTIKKSLLYI